MLNQAGRNTAPHHLEFQQTQPTGSGTSHWAAEFHYTPDEPDLQRSPRPFLKFNR